MSIEYCDVQLGVYKRAPLVLPFVVVPLVCARLALRGSVNLIVELYQFISVPRYASDELSADCWTVISFDE
jgi:hypothetical protein